MLLYVGGYATTNGGAKSEHLSGGNGLAGNGLEL